MVLRKINDHSFMIKRTMPVLLITGLIIGIGILSYVNINLSSQNDKTKSQTAQQTLKVSEKQRNLTQLDNLTPKEIHNNIVKSSRALYSILVENNTAHERYTAAKKQGLISDSLTQQDALFSGQYVDVSDLNVEIGTGSDDLTLIPVYLLIARPIGSDNGSLYADSSTIMFYYDAYEKKFTEFFDYEIS